LDLPNTPGAVADPSQHPLVVKDDLDADDVFKVVAEDDEELSFLKNTSNFFPVLVAGFLVGRTICPRQV